MEHRRYNLAKEAFIGKAISGLGAISTGGSIIGANHIKNTKPLASKLFNKGSVPPTKAKPVQKAGTINMGTQKYN